ncbi:MAG: cobalamin B12-binding domain-containing protein, partial [Firmicutes bacterium]|nr:cobalamin B12-binding domain-containing protein [Bacillota bacterium]
FVPEMLIAAKTMDMATEYLRPLLVDGDSTEAIGSVCLGTIKGDMHDIGKNLVKIMMEGCGLDVIDLGVDVPPEKFIEATLEKGCDIIACSALLTPCLPNIRRLAELIQTSELKDKVKLMIGGAPVSQGFCDEIGADIYTEDAGSAAREAIKALLS